MYREMKDRILEHRSYMQRRASMKSQNLSKNRQDAQNTSNESVRLALMRSPAETGYGL